MKQDQREYSSRYRVRIGDESLQMEHKVIDDPVITGRQIIELSQKRPIDEHLAYQLLPSGKLEEIRLDEKVDLTKSGSEKFVVFDGSASYRFSVDGERYEWGSKFISGQTIFDLSDIDPAETELFKQIIGHTDSQIDATDIIDLSEEGLERFFSKEKGPTNFVVNGRPRQSKQKQISFTEVLNFAFETPPTGPKVSFTMTYRKGHPNKPEGSMLEGDVVTLVEGMVFNVTSTDKS